MTKDLSKKSDLLSLRYSSALTSTRSELLSPSPIMNAFWVRYKWPIILSNFSTIFASNGAITRLHWLTKSDLQALVYMTI